MTVVVQMLILIILLLKMGRSELLTNRETKATMSCGMMRNLSCCKDILRSKLLVVLAFIRLIAFIKTLLSSLESYLKLSLARSIILLGNGGIDISATHRPSRTWSTRLPANSIVVLP